MKQIFYTRYSLALSHTMPKAVKQTELIVPNLLCCPYIMELLYAYTFRTHVNISQDSFIDNNRMKFFYA